MRTDPSSVLWPRYRNSCLKRPRFSATPCRRRGEPRTMTENTDPIARVAGLACWSGPVTPEPLTGGITNKNYTVRDRGERFVVRIGDDIPVHQVMRFNELAASRAAASAGLSPAVIH